MLRSLDWRGRLTFKNFYDPSVRRTFAPGIELSALQEAMHVRTGDGRFFRGFFAFRALAQFLPLLWPVAPFLYLPGIAAIGTRVYSAIARHRHSL